MCICEFEIVKIISIEKDGKAFFSIFLRKRRVSQERSMWFLREEELNRHHYIQVIQICSCCTEQDRLYNFEKHFGEKWLLQSMDPVDFPLHSGFYWKKIYSMTCY